MADPTEETPARRRDAEESRARIVAAAHEVFMSDGFEAASPRAKRPGGTPREA